MPSLSALLAVVAATSAAATPLSSYRYAVKESHPVPTKWTELGPAPADALLQMDISMKQSQFDELERHLYEVSDPDHERYGQHLSPEEVDELVRPSQSTSEQVHDWLASHGISVDDLSYSTAKDWVSVVLPVSAMEEMLKTKYSVFMHEDGSYAIRAPTFSLPEHLHEHIDLISPTTSFFRPIKRGTTLRPVQALGGSGQYDDIEGMSSLPSNPTVAQACNTTLVTPACLRTFYGTYNYKPQVPGTSKVGLTDYLNESNNRSDTKLFLQKYRPEAANAADNFTVTVIANGNNEQSQENATELAAGKDLEGNLDSETILSIAYPIPLTAFTTGGSPPFKKDAATPTDTNEPYLTWVKYVLGQKDLPQVISTSYDDDEQTVPPSYATKVCNSFAQLGARGVTLFFASGDNGVGAAGDCVSNDGKNTSRFLPAFPSTCPYVTSVGATKNFSPEVAAFDPENGFASGGGFSNYFPAPSYQKNATQAYIKSLGSKYAGLYNKTGRGYPDISAQGQHYATIWNGTLTPLDGTSAATPCSAAIFALVNDALLAKGKSPLGFLNPWLYSKGFAALNDITSGSSQGCGTNGFAAAKGWDPVTGYGTPNFKNIRSTLGV